MPAKSPTTADLVWAGDLRFAATFNKAAVTIDGAGVAGPSPVDALVGALAGCMSADVVYTLTKGRHRLRALRAHLVADRAQDNPHRILKVVLHFAIDGEVPLAAVDRAIAHSRDKYCSVWQSMRQDIEFIVTSEISATSSPA